MHDFWKHVVEPLCEKGCLLNQLDLQTGPAYVVVLNFGELCSSISRRMHSEYAVLKIYIHIWEVTYNINLFY